MIEKIRFAVVLLSSIIMLAAYIVGKFKPDVKFYIVLGIGFLGVALILTFYFTV